MKYSLFAIDLDGTLLNRSKKISQANINALKKYASAGGIICIATGRAPSSALKYIAKIEKNAKIRVTYLISMNGAFVKNLITEKVLYKKLLSEKENEDIFQMSKKHDATFASYYSEGYEHGKSLFSLSMGTLVFWMLKRLRGTPITRYRPHESFKVNVLSLNKKNVKRAHEDFQKRFMNKFEIAQTSRWGIEITSEGVSKRTGLLAVAEDAGIALNKCAAIGDSMNDEKIMQYPVTGIAMANSDEKILETAKFKTLSNFDDGVAYAVEKFLLSPEMKLGFCDVEKEITEDNLKEISKHLLTNKKVIITTSLNFNRLYSLVKKHFERYSNLVLIANRGAIVYDFQNEKSVAKHLLDYDLVKSICLKISSFIKAINDEIEFFYDGGERKTVLSSDLLEFSKTESNLRQIENIVLKGNFELKDLKTVEKPLFILEDEQTFIYNKKANKENAIEEVKIFFGEK